MNKMMEKRKGKKRTQQRGDNKMCVRVSVRISRGENRRLLAGFSHNGGILSGSQRSYCSLVEPPLSVVIMMRTDLKTHLFPSLPPRLEKYVSAPYQREHPVG